MDNLLKDNSKGNRAEYEAVDKGYRNDVFVKIQEDYFNVRVYDIVRLKQDFESEVEEYGYYSADPNLVLVTEVTTDNVLKIISQLYEEGYFNHLKPVDNHTLDLEDNRSSRSFFLPSPITEGNEELRMPMHYATTKDLLEHLHSEKYNYYVILSSYGLNDWIISKEYKIYK